MTDIDGDVPPVNQAANNDPFRNERDILDAARMLGEDTRLAVIRMLAQEGELHVTAMTRRLGISQPALSHHLALLRNANLVEARRDGKFNYYSIGRNGRSQIAKVMNVIRRFGGGQESNGEEITMLERNGENVHAEAAYRGNGESASGPPASFEGSREWWQGQ